MLGQFNSPGQVYTPAHNNLIVVVIKRVVKQAAGHCVAVLFRSAPAHFLYYLEKLRAVPARGYIHLHLLELINLSSLEPKGCWEKKKPQSLSLSSVF